MKLKQKINHIGKYICLDRCNDHIHLIKHRQRKDTSLLTMKIFSRTLISAEQRELILYLPTFRVSRNRCAIRIKISKCSTIRITHSLKKTIAPTFQSLYLKINISIRCDTLSELLINAACQHTQKNKKIFTTEHAWADCQKRDDYHRRLSTRKCDGLYTCTQLVVN